MYLAGEGAPLVEGNLPAGRKDHFPHKSLIALNLFRALSSFGSQHPVPGLSTEAALVVLYE